ncbi:hypothetical protein D3C73_1598870 [compost metagenome]
MSTCQCTCLQQTLVASFIHDSTSAATGVRPDVDNMIRQLDYIGIMLDDNHGIPLVSQLLEQFI